MSDFWDYRGWSRNEENNDWQDIQGDNLEYRADALLNRAHQSGHESEDLDKTITYLSAAVDLNRQIERIPELLECLLMLGDCYLAQGKGDDVAETAREAEKIALQSFNDSARAKAIHLQGYNYFLQKKHSIAADHSANAGQLYEAAFDLDEAFAVYMAAGRLYRWNGERDKSLEAFNNALRVAKTNEDLERILDAKTWLAYMQLRVTPTVDLGEAKTNLDLVSDQLKLAKFRVGTSRQFDLANAWLRVHTDPLEAARNFDALIEIARSDKETSVLVEFFLGRAYALGQFERGENYVQSLRSILAILEDLDAPVAILEVAKPLATFYIENEQFQEAELVWVRARALAEKREESAASLTYYDQMIALCIAEYAEPSRALSALENALPKTIEKPLPFDFEFALAKVYAANDRSTESFIVIDRALATIGEGQSAKLEYAELHELKCELLAGQGNEAAAKSEAKLSFDAYFDLNRIDKAKRLKAMYLQPQPGDANPETGAITLGNWG
jgi:tetratricopeptide (TPR) repeat protein